MVSVVSICNLALGHLGADHISDLSEASTEARTCKRFYDQTRDTLLGSGYPWSFAKATADLAEAGGVAKWRWEHTYPKPADCLRVKTVHLSNIPGSLGLTEEALWAEELGTPYELSAGHVLCNISPATLRYIRREVDPSKYDPLFVEALSWHLAARLAMPLTRDPMRRSESFQMAMQTQAMASAGDANDERNSADFMSDYERARN